MQIKKGILFLAVIFILLQIMSCGVQNQRQTEVKISTDAYLTAYTSLLQGENIQMGCADNERLYYTVEDSQETVVYTFSIDDKTSKEFLLPVGEQELLSEMAVDAENNIHFISFDYMAEPGKENETNSRIRLKKITEEGAFLSEMDITDLFRNQDLVIVGMAVDRNGNTVLSTLSNEIFVIGIEGNMLFQTKADGQIIELCRTREGNIVITCQAGTETEIQELDIEKKKLAKNHKSELFQHDIKISPGITTDLLISTGGQLYGYDLNTQDMISILKWADCYINNSQISMIAGLPNGSIAIFSRNVTSDSAEVTLVRKAEEGEAVKEKTILTLGIVRDARYLYFEGAIQRVIFQYNMAHDDYQIEIKEYGTGPVKQEAYEEWLLELNLDIVSGRCPDILVIPPQTAMGLYGKKGILEDLYPYIDADEELKREDFLENILKAYETGDALYGMPVSFGIRTLVGKEADVGTGFGWTLDEMITFAQNYIPESTVFYYTSKSSVLYLCMTANYNELVDLQAEKDAVNKELYKKMLIFSNQFIDDNIEQEMGNIQGRIEDGQLLLQSYNSGMVLAYSATNALFGEPVNIIGYPSEKGTGSLFASNTTFGISANTPYKDQAWECIREFLLQEFQDNANKSEFPVRRDSLEKQLENATELTQYNNRSIRIDDFDYGFGFSQIKVTPEEVDTIRTLIQQMDTAYLYDKQIANIFTEEAGAYFNGVKSADEAAEIAANRIQTYIDEMK